KIEKAKPIKCGTFGATSLQQRYLATGDFGGNLNIWNLEVPEIPVYSVKGHKEIINSIDGVGGLGIGEGAPEIVTGSRDGELRRSEIYRVKRVSVFCLILSLCPGNAYNQEERVVCAGYDNGDIKLFDLKTMSLRWETNIKNGVCSLEFDRKDVNMNKLVATSLEGKFHVFDMRTQHPTKGFASVSEKAQKSTIWQVRHLPQNRDIFMTSGGAGSLHLWKYEYPAQRSKKDSEGAEMGVAGSVSLLQNVTLSTQPISSLDWSPDKKGLCVCGAFDQTVRVLIVTKLNKV
ncbi:WDR92 protein, partial [Spizaetus tyrannus]|nr:WDR92 protein [Spizaetus tyrannus]